MLGVDASAPAAGAGGALAAARGPMSATVNALLDAAFGGETQPLAAWYGALLARSPALRAFTAANAAKIRKKARHARAAEERRDLRCELAVAAALADPRGALIYEPLAAAGGRGPDFLLRHKGHTDVYVEVSRLRPAAGQAHDDARLAALLCGKLGQLVAGAANMLVVVSDAGPYAAEDVGAALLALRRRADARDDAYFAYRGLAGARALHEGLPRLGAVLVAAPAEAAQALYLHAAARRPLPADLARGAAQWRLAEWVGPPEPGAAPAEGP